MKLLKFSFTLLLAALFTLHGCSSTSNDPDVQFAQTAFTALATGNPSAEGMLDWPSLRMAGLDIGAQYNALPSETEKASNRAGFVSSFASSFQAKGASADSLTNWRVQDAANHIVAADTTTGGTMSITISTPEGTRKISNIEFGSN